MREEDGDDGYGEASRYTAHLDRGWSLLDRGDLDLAAQSAEQAHQLRPDVSDAPMLLGAIALAQGDPDAALGWYDKAIELDGEYVEAHIAAAQVLLYDLADSRRALERTEQIRELDEALPIDHLDIGLLEVEAHASLNEYEQADARLRELTDLSLIEELFAATTTSRRQAELLARLGGTHHEGDEFELPFGRCVQIAIRVAQALVDVGRAREAIAWIEGLLHRFADDAELWYLLNEASFVAGEPATAVHAAMQVHRLDGQAPLPAWAPSHADLQRRVGERLLESGDRELADAAGRPEFTILVDERPPAEFVLEGVDPRLRALALATRAITSVDTEAPSPPILTGVAVYRSNLLRFVRDEAGLWRELDFALFDELAAFFGLDDDRRTRLGLPAADVHEPAPALGKSKSKSKSKVKAAGSKSRSRAKN